MASNNIISVSLFGYEIGRIGINEDERRSSFQYNPDFLQRTDLLNIFPKTGIIKNTTHVQSFDQFNTPTFHGLPPQFADSLPDMFGSIIFKVWLENKGEQGISVLEQLAYVANRGMGALEYSPRKELPLNTTIDLSEIIEVLKEVLDFKTTNDQKKLDNQALINIFKMGTSAGGARPKILISENKKNGNVIPGDIKYSDAYNHYLVKLSMDDEVNYPREVVEYCYYLILMECGIDIMESKLIDDKHFATLRFDRQDGGKQHVLTATGMTGWDYKDPKVSSYENLFKLCSFLKISHAQIEELFRRMVFNVIYGNTDDHLKNHSFIYNEERDRWRLSPAYDITYALNPILEFRNTNRALSLNGKRNDILLSDIYKIADDYTIKNPESVVRNIQSKQDELLSLFKSYDIPETVSESIRKKIVKLI